MAKQLQLRRGTATQHTSFTGAEGEVTVDTTNYTLVVHDGSTAGGYNLLKSSELTSAIGSTIQGYDADTAKTDVAQTFTAAQRGQVTTLTDAATITPDLSVSNNYTVTLGGNRTIANPTSITAGQSGSIFIVQDGTGSRTLSWGSYWDFASGTAPVLSTTAGAVDRLDYVVRSSTSIHAVLTVNYS